MYRCTGVSWRLATSPGGWIRATAGRKGQRPGICIPNAHQFDSAKVIDLNDASTCTIDRELSRRKGADGVCDALSGGRAGIEVDSPSKRGGYA